MRREALGSPVFVRIAALTLQATPSLSGRRGPGALDRPILADPTTLTDWGIVLGAALASSAAGLFAAPAPRRLRLRPAIGALLGGALMGYSSSFSYGCNIGAMFSGIASSSLHGWIWGACALLGTWVGLRLRPIFGLAVPLPGDAAC